MNTKSKWFAGLMLSVFALSLFAVAPNASADSYTIDSCRSATLFGSVNPQGNNVNVWFEWGRGSSFNLNTPKKGPYSGFSKINFQESLSLQEDTEYGFRSVVQDVNGGTILRADPIFFRTSRCTTTNPPNVNLTANPSTITQGQSTTLSWSSTNATSCSANWTNSNNTSGTATVSPSSTRSFSIECSNSNGQKDTDEVTVVVNPINNNPGNVTVNIFADDENITKGQSVRLGWTSTNATSCTASGNPGWFGQKATSANNVQTGALFNDTTFRLTCSNGSSTATDAVTINVEDNDDDDDNNNDDEEDVIIKKFEADDDEIDEDDETTIRWVVENADSCEGENGNSDWRDENLDEDSGSFRVEDLDEDTTFRLVCENDDDSASASLTIEVDSDDDDNNIRVTLEANDTSIESGDRVTLRWRTDNAESCEAESGTSDWRNEDPDEDGGTFRTDPLSRDTTFRITCENDDGDEDSDSVTIRVDDDNDFDFTSSPTAVTTIPTQLTNSSVQLNGLIFTGGSNTSAWFEWGSTINLGARTSAVAVGSGTSVRHADTISGLSVGSTYFYRAVAENNGGISRGNIMSFNMSNLGGTTNTTTTVNRTTVINTGGSGTPSLVMLRIDGGMEFIAPGERRSYEVEWRNTSSQTLRDVVLRVILPADMNFEGATQGVFSQDENTLLVDLGNLAPGEEDDLMLMASADRDLVQGQLVVVVANMVYTDSRDNQGEAIAYATHTAGLYGSVLGASAFGAGFLPDTFFGWLLLLILLFIVVLLARHLYRQMQNDKYPPQPVAHH